jgi:hypothetical protein
VNNPPDMTATPGQRKSNENAKRRARAFSNGKTQRLLRGTINRVEEEAAIKAAVDAGKITYHPMVDRVEGPPIVRGHSSAPRIDPTERVSIGEHSRGTPKR